MRPQLNRRVRRFSRLLAASLASVVLVSNALGASWQPPDPYAMGDQPQVTEGMEVLTRGPLHEAFAEPVVFDPRPGPLVPKEPPPPVEEAPPEQKPEGANVQWIPGYWAWDDSRNDFLWISGLWRDMPPGRQWVPGYWATDLGGYRFVPGAWSALQQSQEVDYYPTPPASLEAGPNSPAPAAGAIWSPGYWFWQDQRYLWRPGFWVNYQPDWVWVPAHYVWTPNGYLFVTGYWDLPAIRRGTCFAPIYFSQPIYARPAFVYTPTISLVATVLVSSLFVRPSCHQYYFGDYYAAGFQSSGIYPWFSYQQTRIGCDPVFAHYSTTIIRQDPAWLGRIHDDYRYRREHPEARPPHTYVEMQRVVNRSLTVNHVTNVNVTNVNQNSVQSTRNLVLARPINQIAANPRIVSNARFAPGLNDNDLPRFTRLDDARRVEVTRRADDLRQFRQDRLKLERDGVLARTAARSSGPPRAAGPPDRPERLTLSRSPISAQLLQAQPAGGPAVHAGRPFPVPPDPAARGNSQRTGSLPPALRKQEAGEALRESVNRQQAELQQRRQAADQQREALLEQRQKGVERRRESLREAPRPAPPRPAPGGGIESSQGLPRPPRAVPSTPGLPPRPGPRPQPPGNASGPGLSAFAEPRRIPQHGQGSSQPPAPFGPRPQPPGNPQGPGASALAERQQRVEALKQQRREEVERRTEARKGQPQPGRPLR